MISLHNLKLSFSGSPSLCTLAEDRRQSREAQTEHFELTKPGSQNRRKGTETRGAEGYRGGGWGGGGGGAVIEGGRGERG